MSEKITLWSFVHDDFTYKSMSDNTVQHNKPDTKDVFNLSMQ